MTGLARATPISAHETSKDRKAKLQGQQQAEKELWCKLENGRRNTVQR